MEVTEEVFNEYQAVQRAGPVNMTNKSGVQRYAASNGFDHLVAFIEDGEYYDLLMSYDVYAEEYGDA